MQKTELTKEQQSKATKLFMQLKDQAAIQGIRNGKIITEIKIDGNDEPDGLANVEALVAEGEMKLRGTAKW